MLHAIISMYNVTTCLLGSTTINTFIGVRQGSPTSCFLFILYVDMLIRSIKNNVEDDSFLKWLHILMLMDDTVIFASSRERLLRKLEYLNEFCVEYGMVINEKKTKIMVVNGEDIDRLPIHLGDVCIRHCTDYVYLGSIITEDGKLSSSILEHALEKEKSLNKLILFLSSNSNAPFSIKVKVFKAAFTALILYGMETWIGASIKPVERLYTKGLKTR